MNERAVSMPQSGALNVSNEGEILSSVVPVCWRPDLAVPIHFWERRSTPKPAISCSLPRRSLSPAKLSFSSPNRHVRTRLSYTFSFWEIQAVKRPSGSIRLIGRPAASGSRSQPAAAEHLASLHPLIEFTLRNKSLKSKSEIHSYLLGQVSTFPDHLHQDRSIVASHRASN